MEQTNKLSIHTLKIHPRNQEFFDDIEGEIYEQFKKSIQEDGVITPLIISPDMTIISGNQRFKACKDLGIELVPVIIREELIDDNIKTRQLIASNFGRLKNNPDKMRKAITEYVELVGNKNGGYKKSECQVGTMSQSQIAKELGISERELQRILSIERNLIPELKQAMDKGFISKTAALGICGKLNKSEQKDLLNELTNLIGDKVESEPKKEKVSASNIEIEKLTEQVKKECEEKEKIKLLNTDLLTKTSELEQLKNDLKNKLDSSNKDYRQLKEDFDKKNSEISDLKKQINSLKSVTEEEKYAKKLKDSAIFFCSRVNDFIEKTGGFVWLSESINELPDYERKSYIKAIELIENWVLAIKSNMKNYI